MFLRKIINIFLIVTIISANCVGNANLRSLQPHAFESSSLQNNKIAIESKIELSFDDKKRIRKSLSLEEGLNLDEKSLAKIDVNLSKELRAKIKSLFELLTEDEIDQLDDINFEQIISLDELGIGYEILKKLDLFIKLPTRGKKRGRESDSEESDLEQMPAKKARYTTIASGVSSKKRKRDSDEEESDLEEILAKKARYTPPTRGVSSKKRKRDFLEEESPRKKRKINDHKTEIIDYLQRNFGVKNFSLKKMKQLDEVDVGWVDYAKYINYKTASYVMPELNELSISAVLSAVAEMIAIQEGARLDTIIGRQASGFGAQIGELISNGLDAMGLPSIGRFGFGFNQIFKELEDDGDRVVVYTRANGADCGRQIIFKKVGDRILFQDKKIDGLRNGTRVEVQKAKKIPLEKRAEILDTIRKKYRWNDVAIVNLYTETGAEIVNKLDYETGSGKAGYRTRGEVNVFVGDSGYVVEDSGKGMNEEEIFEHLLKPRNSTKARVQGGQTLKYKAGEKNALTECTLDLLVGGVRVQGYKFTGLNLPKAMAIDLGYDVDLGADRSRINFNEKVIASLSLLIDKAISYQGENRYQLFNAMSELIRQMQEEIKEKDQLTYSEFFNLKEIMRSEVKKISHFSKTKFFIAREGMENLALAKMADLEFIDRDLGDIDMLKQCKFVNGLEEVSAELYTGYNGYKLFLADFGEEIQDAYLDINLNKRGGAIIVDRKIYEKYKMNPKRLNMLINKWIGYGKKPEKKLELKVWHEVKPEAIVPLVSSVENTNQNLSEIIKYFGLMGKNIEISEICEISNCLYVVVNHELYKEQNGKFIKIDGMDKIRTIKVIENVLYVQAWGCLYQEKNGKFSKLDKFDNDSVVKITDFSILDKDKFRKLNINVNSLWFDLLKNGYISKEGKVLDKLTDLESFLLDEKFRLKRNEIFNILKKFKHNKSAYVYTEQNVYKIEGGKFIKIEGLDKDKDKDDIEMFEFDGVIYVTTDNTKIYKLENDKFCKINQEEAEFVTIKKIKQSLYVVLMDNFVCEEQNGKFVELYKLNFQDSDSENPIQITECLGKVFFWNDDTIYEKRNGEFKKLEIDEKIVSVENFTNTVYIISKNCVYKQAEKSFKKIPISGVLKLQELDGIVYAVTTNGIFKEQDDSFVKINGIDKITGHNIFLCMQESTKNFYLMVNDNCLYRQENGTFVLCSNLYVSDIESLPELFEIKKIKDKKYAILDGKIIYEIIGQKVKKTKSFELKNRLYFFSFSGVTAKNQENIKKLIDEFNQVENVEDKYKNNFMFYLFENGMPEGIKLESPVNKYMVSIIGEEIEKLRAKDYLVDIESFVQENVVFFNNFGKSELYWQIFKNTYNLAVDKKSFKLFMTRIKELIDGNIKFATEICQNFEKEDVSKYFETIEVEGMSGETKALRYFLSSENLEDRRYKSENLGFGFGFGHNLNVDLGLILSRKAVAKKVSVEEIYLFTESAIATKIYRSVVESQNIDLLIYLRELVQNSRDAYQKVLGEIEIEDGFEKLSDGSENYVVSVEDHVGMDINQVLNDLLVPDVSTKSGVGSTGLFGVGFFTVFQEADEVVIRTGKGSQNWRITLKVERFPDGKLDRIKISEINQYGGPYTGTKIEVKKKVVNKSKLYVESMGLQMRLMQYVGGVSKILYRRDNQGIVQNSAMKEQTVRIRYKKDNILNEERELVSEIATKYGKMRLMLRRDRAGKYTQGGYIEQKGLYVSPIERSLLKYVPKELWESLNEDDRRSLVIEIPEGMKLTSSRGVVMQEGEELEKMIATAVYKWLLGDYLQKGKRLYGLSEDYFWKSSTTNYEVSLEIQIDAENLNVGNYQAVDMNKYIGNMKDMMKLLILIKDPFSDKSIFEVKSGLGKNQKSSSIVDGVVKLFPVVPIIADIEAEYINRPDIKTEAMKESDITEEQLVMQNFLEQMSKRLKFGFESVGFRMIGNGVAGYGPVYDIKTCKITWDIKFNINICEKFLAKIRKGEKIDDLFYDGSMEGFFQIYWHEWTHTREYENYLNAVLEEISELSGVYEKLRFESKEEVKKYWIGYFSSGQGGHQDKGKVLEILNALETSTNKFQIEKIKFMIENMYSEIANMTTHQSEKSLKGGFADIMHRELTKFVRASADIDFNELLELSRIDVKSEYLLKSLNKSLFGKIKIWINKILLDGKQEESVSIKANSAMMKAS